MAARPAKRNGIADACLCGGNRKTQDGGNDAAAWWILRGGGGSRTPARGRLSLASAFAAALAFALAPSQAFAATRTDTVTTAVYLAPASLADALAAVLPKTGDGNPALLLALVGIALAIIAAAVVARRKESPAKALAGKKLPLAVLVAVSASLVAGASLAFAAGASGVFSATEQVTATYDEAGDISIPNTELKNETDSAVVLDGAKMVSDYGFVSGWTNDAAGKTIAAGETLTIKWTANSKLPADWKKGEKLSVGTVAYTYVTDDAPGADDSGDADDVPDDDDSGDADDAPKALDFSKAGLDAAGLTYDGSEKKPAVTGLDGLVEGKDYKVEYKDNVNAGTATVTVTGIGGYTGSKTFEFTIDTQAVDASGVKVSEDALTYDGKAKEPAVEGIPAGLAQGTDYEVSYESNVNAGAAKVTVAFKGNYSGEKALAFQIAPAQATVTANDASKIYGEDDPVFSAVVSGLVDGEDESLIKYAVSRSNADVEDAGEYKGVIVPAGDELQGNYSVSYVSADFEIAKSDALTVAGEGYCAPYDGQAHGDAATPSVAEGTTVEYSTDGGKTWSANVPQVKDAGSVAVKARATNPNYADATCEYALAVTKREVTLTAGSAEKEYDGTPLTTSEFSAEGFVEGEGVASAAVEGSQTVVGSSQSAVKTGSWKALDGTDLSNYEVKTAPGTLTVTDRTAKYQVTLEGIEQTKTYEGVGQTMYGVKSDKFKIGGLKYQVYDYKSDVTGIDAGEYVQTVTSANADGHWTVKDSAGNDVSAQFSVTTKPGKLTIAPRKVTLTSGSAEKTYDGTELISKDVTVGGDGFVKGEEGGVSYYFSGSQTNQGSSENTFSALFDGTKIKRDNYDVTMVGGTLKVNAITDKVTVTITEQGGSYTYDGKEHSAEGYYVGSSNKLYTTRCFTFSGSDAVGATDAGTYGMALKSEDFTNTSANFTNVDFVIVHNALTISKREVTLTSEGQTFTYNGEAQSWQKACVSSGSFVEGEGIASLSFDKSVTNAGEETENSFTYVLEENTKASNYEITKVYGKLFMEKSNDLKVTCPSYSAAYDGQAHGDAATPSVAEGTTVEYSTDGGGTWSASVPQVKDAGSVAVKARAANPNYADATCEYALAVTKRAVTLTSATDTKVYDGQPLTNDEVSVSGEGFVDDEGASYTVTGTITNVGSVENAFTYELNKGTKADNYTIATQPGTLTVTKSKELTVSGKNYSGTYDGLEHSGAATPNVIEGTTVEYSIDNEKTWTKTVPTVKNTGALIVKARATNPNYVDVYCDYQLTINPRNCTVTTESASKVYDGAPLTAVGSISGIAEGENAGFEVTGSQTNVGSSSNTYELKWNSTAKQSNYYLAYDKLGTLKVTAQSINSDDGDAYKGVTINSPAEKTTYDGDAHKWDPEVNDKSGNALTNGADYEVSYKRGDNATDDFINAGEITVTISGKGNYTGEVTRTYKIAAAQIPEDVLKGIGLDIPTEGYTYDGTEKKPGFTGLDKYVSGVDYDVQYAHNVNAGTAYAIVSFKGNYTGHTDELEFTIKAAEAQGYWLAAAGLDNPSDVSNVLKIADQIAEDMEVLHGEKTATSAGKDKAAVSQEYANYMNGKSADGTKGQEVRLYTRWNGSDVTDEGSKDKYVEFRIIQVGEHDNDGDGVGDDGSAVTFAATHSLPTAQKMNSEMTNAGGWPGSNMYKEVFGSNGYVETGLSELYKSGVVKPVMKMATSGGYGNWTTGLTDESSFWLLSYTEAFGKTDEGSTRYKAEGAQYDWFRSNAISGMSATRAGADPANGGTGSWWLRSPCVNSYGSGFCFCCFNSSYGLPIYDVAMYTHGVVPAFAM